MCTGARSDKTGVDKPLDGEELRLFNDFFDRGPEIPATAVACGLDPSGEGVGCSEYNGDSYGATATIELGLYASHRIRVGKKTRTTK